MGAHHEWIALDGWVASHAADDSQQVVISHYGNDDHVHLVPAAGPDGLAALDDLVRALVYLRARIAEGGPARLVATDSEVDG